MNDTRTIHVYDNRAVEYDQKNRDHNATDPRLFLFINACPEGARVLDLGCGPGTSAAVMAQHGLCVDATDASAEMTRLASQHDGVNARQATFEDLAEIGLYDGIWANFSLLHASKEDFPVHLASVKRALKPGGTFAIAMKLGCDAHRDAIGRFYAYYSETELLNLLKRAGFTAIDQAKGSGPGLDGSSSDWISILCHG